MFVIKFNHERNGAMEYYTVSDIQILTGYKEAEAYDLIEKLNKEIKQRYKTYPIKPLIFVDKIEKNYFLKRMEIEL